MPLVVCLVGYNNTFDSVEIPDVIDALKEQRVEPAVYVNVLQHIYKYAKSTSDFTKTLHYSDCKGKYGSDTSSPKLFIARLEKVFHNSEALHNSKALQHHSDSMMKELETLRTEFRRLQESLTLRVVEASKQGGQSQLGRDRETAKTLQFLSDEYDDLTSFCSAANEDLTALNI